MIRTRTFHAVTLGAFLLLASVVQAQALNLPLSDGTPVTLDVSFGGQALSDLTLRPGGEAYSQKYESALLPGLGTFSGHISFPSEMLNAPVGGNRYVYVDVSYIQGATLPMGAISNVFHGYWDEDGNQVYERFENKGTPDPVRYGPYPLSGGSVSVDFTASYNISDQAWQDQYYLSIGLGDGVSSQYGGVFGSATFYRLLSGQYIIGGSPDKEGTKDDNQETVFEDEDGPSSCSPNGQGLPSYAVNTSTRGLVLRDVLFATKGLGPEMRLELAYSPVPGRNGTFGNGWSFSLDDAVDMDCSSAILTKGSHKALSFSGSLCPSSPSYPIALTPTKGTYDRLERVEAGFAYTPKGSRDTRRLEWTADNAKWRLSAVTDTNGNTLTVSRNPDGTMASVTDAAGRTASFTYASGRCTRIDAPGGTHASFVYDASGNLVRVTDLAGVVTEYGYNGENYLVSMTVGGKITHFAYDATDKGALASLTDAEGNVVTYARDAGSGAITRTDAKSGQSVYYNQNGATSLESDPLGQSTSYALDATTGLTGSVTEPGGVTMAYEYDARGNTTRITRSKDGLSQVWSMTYDAEDNLLTRTDPRGNIWRHAYEGGTRNLLSTTTPTGLITTYAYFANGLLHEMTLPGGRKWTFAHDGRGNPSSIENPLGQVTTNAYDVVGNLISTRDPRGNTTTFAYDANRRRTRANFPGGASIQAEYACCAPASETDELGNVTRYEYDNMLRLVSRTDPLGAVMAFEYDENGNQTRLVNPLGHAKTMAYDAADRFIGGTDALNKTSQLEYTALGKPGRYIDESGRATTISYDALGRYTGMTDPLGGAVAFSLDASGAISGATNARGGQVGFSRDDDGRLTAKTYGPTQVASFVYDAATGDLASATTPGYGAVAYTRDGLGRVTRIDYPDGKSAGFAYDAAGNMNAVTYPGALTLSLAHDARNRISSLAIDALTMNLGYDAAGRLTSESRSNGATSAYGFNAAGQLTGVTHAVAGAPFIALAYARDLAGKVTGETGTRPLAPWQTASTGVGAFDAANRPLTFGPESMTVDADGNVTGISGSRSITVAYDPENRPTSIVSGGVTTTYVHDAQGNRVRRTRGGIARNFHYDHLGRLLFETDGTGAVTMLHVYAGKRLVASGTPSGGFRFYHHDKTGDILAVTDAAGTVTAAFAYDPYGRVLGRSGSSGTDFSFVGALGVMEEGDGIFFMRNRYYDAVTGRFLQKDPIGFDGGRNFYRYADGNPVLKVDPNGTGAIIPIVIGGIALISYAYNVYGTGEHVAKGAEKAGEAYQNAQNAVTMLEQVDSNIQVGVAMNKYDTCKTQEEKMKQPFLQRQAMTNLLDSWFSFTSESSNVVSNGAEAVYRGARAGTEASGMNKIPTSGVNAAGYVIQNGVMDNVDQTVVGK